ncbi:MAG: PilN domain-containing protein [Acidobacteria bacterium]|nr:PilN domain-containing protein [Acidobacteriota bacterium]
MIRINLLTVETARPKRRKRIAVDVAQKVPIACSFILVGTALALGWWYWSLQKESARLAEEVAAAEQETIRLRTQIMRVLQFEQQRAQLTQRVNLIETLRRGQSGPVHLLDEVSRSLPEMLWLTGMTQQNNDITIEGRCTTLTAVSDFIANLESSTYFKKPVELTESAVESPQPGQPDLIKFTLKAQFEAPAR